MKRERSTDTGLHKDNVLFYKEQAQQQDIYLYWIAADQGYAQQRIIE